MEARRNFEFEAQMAAILFGQLMKDRIKDAPVREYCPKEVTKLFERVIHKAFTDGYYTHASEMESLFFELKSKDNGLRYETNRETYEWIQGQIKKS